MTWFNRFALFTIVIVSVVSRSGLCHEGSVYPPAGHYRIDPKHCSLIFKVKHLGYSYFVGRFNVIDGEMTFDPAETDKTALTVTVDPASIDVNNPSLESDLKGERWLNVIRYKTASFTLTKLVLTDPTHGRVEGTLDWRGIKKNVTFSVTLIGFGDSLFAHSQTLGLSISGELERSDFGITNLATFVDNSVALSMDVEFNKVD